MFKYVHAHVCKKHINKTKTSRLEDKLKNDKSTRSYVVEHRNKQENNDNKTKNKNILTENPNNVYKVDGES